MNFIQRFCVTATLLLPLSLFSQKETITLTCPLEHSLGREPKEAYTWQPADLKVIMISNSDSLALSCINGTVSNVNPAEDGTYEVVVYYKNLYFWYVGVINPMVKKGQNVKARQPIAHYKAGTELEFRMFKNEEPMDPRDLLECRIMKAN